MEISRKKIWQITPVGRKNLKKWPKFGELGGKGVPKPRKSRNRPEPQISGVPGVPKPGFYWDYLRISGVRGPKIGGRFGKLRGEIWKIRGSRSRVMIKIDFRKGFLVQLRVSEEEKGPFLLFFRFLKNAYFWPRVPCFSAFYPKGFEPKSTPGTENRRKSAKNRRKRPKIVENDQKSSKIGQNRRKSAEI